MKGKIRTVINYGIILLVILATYNFFVWTIYKVIPTYQKQMQTYENQYDEQIMELEQRDIEDYVEIWIGEKEVERLSSKQEENLLLGNQVLFNIKTYVEGQKSLQGKEEISSIIKLKNTDFGDIYVLYTFNGIENNKIIFTEDMKNILIVNVGYAETNSAMSVGGKIVGWRGSKNVPEMVAKIEQCIQEMQIELKEELNFTKMYAREYDIADTYYMEDQNNELMVIYEAKQNKILKLMLGFTQ